MLIKYYHKLLKIYFSYLTKKININYYPVKLWVEVTNHCNLKCRLCPNKDIPDRKKGFMSFQLFKKIIDEAEGKVHDINLFHRGEPLLHPDLFSMIKYANSKKITVKIHTNATLLNKKKIKEIFDSRLDSISFSFDGYLKSTYCKNRVNSSYEKTLKGIIDFLKEKKRNKHKKPYTVLQIMEYDDEYSTKDFKLQKKEFLRNFKSLPLNEVVTRTPHNWGGLIALRNKKSAADNKSYAPCTFPWYALVVLYDGTVVPCPQDFTAKLVIGDAGKESLKDIFGGKLLQDLRHKFKLRKIKDLKPCSNCDRLHRKTFLGVPSDYMLPFIKDALKIRRQR